MYYNVICTNGRQFTMFGRNNYVAYHKSDLPASLRPFLGHTFFYGESEPDDWKSFQRKYKNAIKKMLPDGWEIVSWNGKWFTMSGMIKTADDRYVYMSVSDVRYEPHGWIGDILIRTAKNDHDWTGGSNHFTSLFEFSEDVQKLYR